MAAILWSDVVTVDASLASTAVALQTEILAYVHEVVGVHSLGGEESHRLKLARIYLAAHMAVIAKQIGDGQATGPVTSRSIGGISKSWLAPQMTDDGLQRTGHGSLYLFVVRNAPRTQGFRA